MVNVPDFDSLYRDDPDPWRVASSFYEQRKQAVLLASLTRAYGSAWDPGCGTGELAAQLAHRADAVLATDTSAEAVLALTSEPGWHAVVRHDDQDFVLDVLRRDAS